MSPEEEWKAAAARGAASRRAALIPKLAGAGAFAVVFAALFFGLGGWLGARQAAEDAALREQGLERVVIKYGRGGTRVVSEREQATDAGVLLFVLSFGGGLLVGVGAFLAAGGKFSAEHVRALQGQAAFFRSLMRRSTERTSAGLTMRSASARTP